MKGDQLFDGFSRMQVLQLYACGRCGECILSCPIYVETQDQNLAPSFKIKALKALADTKYGIRAMLFGSKNINQDEVKRVMASIYHCTLCGRCMTVCPYEFDLIELWETVREQADLNDLATELGALPTLNLLGMLKTTVEEKNVLGRPHARRKNWMRRLDVPEKNRAETLYFVGCAISYTPSLKTAAKGVTTILNAAKEDWAPLSEEWCCGIPLKFGGETEHFKEFITHNVETIEAAGAKKVVFSCPGCYRMFKQIYPKVLGRPLKFAILHIAELTDEYIKNGKISLKKSKEKITYHDPCELARLLGVIEQPRNVLSELSTSLLELPENKVNTLCCGGGGLYKAVDTETSLEIAKKRIRQAEAIGSETLISACPSCVMNLHQATRFMKSNVKVRDFADAIAQQIENEN
jgi:heterodisulfide reductase subunit D